MVAGVLVVAPAQAVAQEPVLVAAQALAVVPAAEAGDLAVKIPVRSTSFTEKSNGSRISVSLFLKKCVGLKSSQMLKVLRRRFELEKDLL